MHPSKPRLNRARRHRRFGGFTAFFISAIAALAQPTATPPSLAVVSPAAPQAAELLLNQLYGPFRSESYLEVAAALQALPEAQRIARLRAWAKSPADLGNSDYGIGLAGGEGAHIVVLCRMLFEAKPGQAFRARLDFTDSFVGDDPVTVGGTSTINRDAWPLAPIALVDGIPFLVATGFQHGTTIGGLAEGASLYLEYCLRETQWASHRFAHASLEVRQKAMDKQIREHAWARPPNGGVIAFLSDQLRPPVPPPNLVPLELKNLTSGWGIYPDALNTRLKVLDPLGIDVVGSGRPFHFSVARKGTGGAEPAVISYGTGKSGAGDTTSVEELTIPWPKPEPAVGEQLIVTVTNTEGKRAALTFIVIGPKEIEVVK